MAGTSKVKQDWKTTLLGLLGAAAAIASVWVPVEYQGKIVATSAVLSSAGLVAAKDRDK